MLASCTFTLSLRNSVPADTAAPVVQKSSSRISSPWQLRGDPTSGSGEGGHGWGCLNLPLQLPLPLAPGTFFQVCVCPERGAHVELHPASGALAIREIFSVESPNTCTMSEGETAFFGPCFQLGSEQCMLGRERVPLNSQHSGPEPGAPLTSDAECASGQNGTFKFKEKRALGSLDSRLISLGHQIALTNDILMN